MERREGDAVALQSCLVRVPSRSCFPGDGPTSSACIVSVQAVLPAPMEAAREVSIPPWPRARRRGYQALVSMERLVVSAIPATGRSGGEMNEKRESVGEPWAFTGQRFHSHERKPSEKLRLIFMWRCAEAAAKTTLHDKGVSTIEEQFVLADDLSTLSRFIRACSRARRQNTRIPEGVSCELI